MYCFKIWHLSIWERSRKVTSTFPSIFSLEAGHKAFMSEVPAWSQKKGMSLYLRHKPCEISLTLITLYHILLSNCTSVQSPSLYQTWA
jgi:hypothetical protein